MAGETHEKRLARWAKKGKPGAAPVAAATVILLRDGTEGLETLMLRRNSKLAFVGGMWVFPGGRVDPEDREGLAADDELGHARRAAVREAQEEAGIEVEEASLVALSHWTPPPITPKRFLTWFFLAPAPAGEVVIDEGEIHDHQWMQPADALRRRDAQEIELAPPTWVTLHELSGRASVADALAAARARDPERFETHIGMSASGPVALWFGDAGFEDNDADKPGPRHRLRMTDDAWVYERS
ncbi:MAG: NUDIX hydrolase [Myxococcota bacterium]|nr:NUDIX hydrolase [Myxococcota bacterium]